MRATVSSKRWKTYWEFVGRDALRLPSAVDDVRNVLAVYQDDLWQVMRLVTGRFVLPDSRLEKHPFSIRDQSEAIDYVIRQRNYERIRILSTLPD